MLTQQLHLTAPSEIRFVNNYMQGNRINSQDAAVDIVDNINFDGAKPLGTAIEQKILQPMVLAPARQNALRKPLLVIVITDGQPTGEPFGYRKYLMHNKEAKTKRKLTLPVQQSIVNAANQLNSTPYGPKAVSYQFAQVGTDMSATQFLAALDNDPMVGAMIDCTSDYDIESQEMLQKTGQQLTPIMWLMKLMLGGIDSSYDSQGELQHASTLKSNPADRQMDKWFRRGAVPGFHNVRPSKQLPGVSTIYTSHV